MPDNPSNKLGFTLVETIVVIAVAAILIALAMPNFTSSIRGNRLTAGGNNLLATLNYARSEAVKRGRDVVVRKPTGGNWEDGWQVFVDMDRSTGNADVFNDDGDTTLCEATEDCVLKVFPSLPAGYTLRGKNNLVDFIRYTPTGISNYIPDGKTGIANDYLVLCDNRDGNETAEADTSRLIVFSTVGRARLGLDTDTAKDGVPDDNSGNNVADCTP